MFLFESRQHLVDNSPVPLCQELSVLRQLAPRMPAVACGESEGFWQVRGFTSEP